MDLCEVLKTYLGGDQKGQLVIKFVGEAHLCKISIEDGQAIYLTLGTMGPDETLDEIVGKVTEWTNFIKGMPARKRLDQPINQLLLDIAGVAPLAEGEVPLAATTGKDVPAISEVVVEDTVVDANKIKRVIDQFINLVGPFGTILTERICSNLSHTDGDRMTAVTYTRFVAALAAEVPENDRQGFVDAAAQ